MNTLQCVDTSMEVILVAVRPKQPVHGLDYRSKLYDILLLDHKNVDKTGKPTKYFPAFPLTAEEEPRDEILKHLYNLTGGEHGGIKGERALVIPWNKKEGHRDSLSHFSLFCIPISPRDKLNSNFVEKSQNSPGFYSLDNLIHSLHSNSMNFPPPTRTFVSHLESWLKEKHSKPGALEIVFRSRADFRIKVWVNNPVFLPFSMSSTSTRTDVPEEIRVTANELFAKMMVIEKCNEVVINPLFGSSLATKVRPVVLSRPWPSPDYIDSTPASRKSSLDSINFDDTTLSPLHKYAAKGDYVKVQEFLMMRVNSISGRDIYGWHALHYAARYGAKDVVQLLLQRGCSPNIVTADDQTPLHLAASKGYPSVVNILLSHPEIDINVVDKGGKKAIDMCKDKLGWEHIQVARKLEAAMHQPKQMQVHLMDGTNQSLNLVDGANTTVQQLNQQILRFFNMPETPYADIFTIWLCGPSLELQLKPEHKPIEHMNAWTQRLVSMLTDGDPKQEKPYLKWRRNAKISLIVEREVMHTDAIRLLFHEARINYIEALYPCKEQDVLILASILLYLDYGGSDMSTVKRFLSSSTHLASLVPSPMLRSVRGGTKILHQYRELSGQITERNEARLKSILYKKFLDSCRNLTVYGSTFFTGSLHIGNSKTVKCVIGVNDVGLHIINAVTRLMLHTYKYSEITWDTPPYPVQLDVRVLRTDIKSSQGNTPTMLKLKSKQAGMIHILMKKLSHINSYYGVGSYPRGISAN